MRMASRAALVELLMPTVAVGIPLCGSDVRELPKKGMVTAKEKENLQASEQYSRDCPYRQDEWP